MKDRARYRSTERADRFPRKADCISNVRSRVSDPNPYQKWLNSDQDSEVKNEQQKTGKSKKLSCFEVLDAFFWGLKALKQCGYETLTVDFPTHIFGAWFGGKDCGLCQNNCTPNRYRKMPIFRTPFLFCDVFTPSKNFLQTLFTPG
jgi:hypothetical protein